MNTVILLLSQLIIGPEHGFVHIYSFMTLYFSHFGIQIPLSNYYCRKQTGMLMCLTLGVNILDSIT